MAGVYVLLPPSKSSPFSPLQPHQMLLSPLAPAGSICHLHAKSSRILPGEQGHPFKPLGKWHGRAGTVSLTSCLHAPS